MEKTLLFPPNSANAPIVFGLGRVSALRNHWQALSLRGIHQPLDRAQWQSGLPDALYGLAIPAVYSSEHSRSGEISGQEIFFSTLPSSPSGLISIDLGRIYTPPSRYPTKLSKVFWKLYASQGFCWLAFSLTAQQTPWPVWHWVKTFHIFGSHLHPRIMTLISHMQELEHREIK